MRNLINLHPILEGYSATHDGRIISRKNKQLKQFRRNKQSRCPYLSVTIWDSKSGFARPFYVHRLVAYQYCDLHINNIDNLVVNHIDGNPHNNHSHNLEWVTQKENVSKSKSYRAVIT